MGVEEDIRNNYPALSFLINEPTVGPLLREAVDPNVGFSPNEFQARLYETGWFKMRSQRQREWEIISNTDPGEAASQRSQFDLTANTAYGRLGINFEQGHRDWIREGGLQYGDAPGDTTFDARLASFMHQNKQLINPFGSIGATAGNVWGLAHEDYFIPLTHEQAQGWGIDLQLGMKDEESLRSALRMASAATFPHLQERLAAGETMRTITEPYKALIAEELGINPGSIDMTNPKWKPLYDSLFYGSQTSNTQGRRVMTMAESTYYIRQQPEFWEGNKGRAMAASMADSMARIFGKRA